MIEYNSLIINDWSTKDLPFQLLVQENPGPLMAVKKDILSQFDFTDGYVVQSVRAYEPKERTFKLYFQDVTSMEQIRNFAAKLTPSGTYISYDDPTVYKKYVKVELELEPWDNENYFFRGYEGELKFLIQPFSYERTPKVITLTNGMVITNHTDAPMYPKLEISAPTKSAYSIKIGTITMNFKNHLGSYVVECESGKQNVYDSNGNVRNLHTTGDFFVLQPGEKAKVTFDPTLIQSLKMTTSWRWRL